MAEQDPARAGRPMTPAGGPATPPSVLPWLVMYTVGRLGIFAALTLVLLWVGLPLFTSMLFGLLLSMPIAYVLLRPSRERLNEGLVARQAARRAEKEQLRSRLSGEQPPA
ncbi:DUF4229 domain-containing protein [Blastococcus sp. CCUG 61487]|uniref:DUF4229 domain-containing protein n=1 Tax=Blastococcus sp. CCUG 61487 TaxID=1840703 RepID=UPI0010BFF005|nr:DUF4229 domain-containing protein [Blastococcus sp. CCUG 61487]TKJ16520.1 hypothetical protein A6V29_13930 [Blastococcus sp. CCUG 61487]